MLGLRRKISRLLMVSCQCSILCLFLKFPTSQSAPQCNLSRQGFDASSPREILPRHACLFWNADAWLALCDNLARS
ncbi:hypothetical protein BDW69DRAFT_168278 [Aspergillus filifer]